jgi:hypothetical protein
MPTPDQLKTILKDHAAWRADKTKGRRANLGGAHLSGANLSGADLGGADLSGAYLGGAHLSGADLSGANLGGANLGGADLSGAYLSRADLSGADLSGADLGGVDHVIALGQPNGWWAFAYLWEGKIWVRIGCRTKSIADGRAYWADKDDRREVLAALDYAETIARLRGWEFK